MHDSFSKSFPPAILPTFLPRGRIRALAGGVPLPEYASGTCLFADISGFTPLAESLAHSLHPQRGAEALTEIINQVFEMLISHVHAYGGDVLGFAGDAITCWFDERDEGGRAEGEKALPSSLIPHPASLILHPSPLRALACAVAMQKEMGRFAAIPTPDGQTHTLMMKVGLACGPARRLQAGAPQYGLFELLAGATLARMADAEHHAGKGEIVCAPEIVSALGEAASWGEERAGFRPLLSAGELVLPSPAPVEALPTLELDALRPYFPPALFEWLSGPQACLGAELRPVVSAFVRFEGLDYEGDPHVQEKLDAYVTSVQQTADRYGGHLIRLDYGDKGSTAHVIFGAPAAHEDDEERAVGWVLALQEAVKELPFITAQYVGITRGQVYAGALGASSRRGYTLMGDEVNASARLMQACQPGQVLVSQRVMQAAQKRFMFHQFPGFQVKGKYEPLPVAMPIAPLPPTQQLIPAGPLVGRDKEMAQLDEILNKVRAGEGWVVRIEGSAGVGKSRLVSELVQRAMAGGVRTLVGSAQSTGQATPYLAWREIVRTMFGLQSAWPAAQQAMQIQTMLQWINPEWLPRLPLFGDLLGLAIPDTPTTAAFDARLRQQSLFALVGDLLARQAAQQPLFILIEDGHWLDESSAALLEALGLSLAHARVLLAVTHRPPDDPDHPLLPGLDGLAHSGRLALDELAPEAARVLVKQRLGGELPPDVMAFIQERAQGNPFFIEELVETIRETGRLQMQDGQWVLAGVDSHSLKLPDTVQGVVLARIDRLEGDGKLTLKVSSVVGRVFELPLLAHVHPSQLAPDALDEQLAALGKRDFVQPEAPQAFRFKHHTIQEVAYGTLLYAQRRALHRAVAEWYEAACGGDRDREAEGAAAAPCCPASPARPGASLAPYLPLLVYHYHHAEDVGKECQYARLAGEQAARQFANDEALRYLERALELSPQADLAGRYELLLAREKVYDLQGKREAQQQDLEALRGLAEALDEDDRRAEVTLRQAYLAEVTGDYPASIRGVQAAVELAQKAGDESKETAGYLQWGRTLWRTGELEPARQQLEQGLSKAQAAQLPQLEASILLNLGLVSSDGGNYPRACDYYGRAMQIYKELGDRVGEGKSLNNLGLVFWLQGDLAQARGYYEQALGICQDIGERQGESILLGNLGVISFLKGDYCGARAYYEQALHICRQIGNRLSEGNTLNNLGFVFLHQGDYAAARDRFEQALALFRQLGERRGEGAGLSNLGLLSHLLNDDEAAREYSRQALHIAREVGDRSAEGEALTHLGHAWAGLGELAEAAGAYEQALAIRRELGEQALAIESLAGLARVTLAQAALPQALAHVEEILDYLKDNNLDGTYEPFRVYLTCYQALAAAHDPRAGQVLASAHAQLQERATRIGEEALRRSFLEKVAAHRDIVSEHARLAQTPKEEKS